VKGKFLGAGLQEEVERVVDRHLDHQVDRDLELARRLGKHQPGLVVGERVLLPVDEVPGGLDPQRIGEHLLRLCGAGRRRTTCGAEVHQAVVLVMGDVAQGNVDGHKAPHGNLNPKGFDQELQLWEQGVQATGYVRAGAQDAPPVRLAVTWRHPVERAREAVRDAAFARIADRRTAGVIAALVTGDQSAIDRVDWDIYRATGVAHLVSISGLHITMFAWLAALAVGWLWRRSTRLMLRWPAQQAALVGGVALAGLYALFSGWGVPSQRTVLMLATVALLRIAGRRWPWPCVWLLACAVVVMADPWALMQAGFWLSFVAVAALFATDASVHGEQAKGRRARLYRLAREQAVVTLALAPLTLLLFQQVSVVGLLANALAIPWVTLVLTPLAMLGAVVPPLWDLAAWAVRALSWWLEWLAAMPLATLSMPAPPLWAAAGGVLGGVLLATRLPWSARRWRAAAAAGAAVAAAACRPGSSSCWRPTSARAMRCWCAPRPTACSTTPARAFRAKAMPATACWCRCCARWASGWTLLMLSHRDIDHIGGAPAVLAMQPRPAAELD
jgi:competence protein ComEC